MTYTKKTTITIPTQRWEAIGDWLIARFLEMFGTDELITQYLDSGRRLFDKVKYTAVATWNVAWVLTGIITIADYQEFLDYLYDNLPSKYRKIGTAWKPWFKNVMPIIDLGLWPLTFEGAALHWKSVKN